MQYINVNYDNTLVRKKEVMLYELQKQIGLIQYRLESPIYEHYRGSVYQDYFTYANHVRKYMRATVA